MIDSPSLRKHCAARETSTGRAIWQKIPRELRLYKNPTFSGGAPFLELTRISARISAPAPYLSRRHTVSSYLLSPMVWNPMSSARPFPQQHFEAWFFRKKTVVFQIQNGTALRMALDLQNARKMTKNVVQMVEWPFKSRF